MKKKLGITLVLSLLLAYLASWLVMPRLGMAYELNFDYGCNAGVFGILDLQGSTCASGGPVMVGFPLVIHPGPLAENLLTIVIDVLAALILFGLLKAISNKRVKPAGI